MKKNKQPDGMPVWFDGKSINEALFCDEFLQTHKIIFTSGAFFTPAIFPAKSATLWS